MIDEFLEERDTELTEIDFKKSYDKINQHQLVENFLKLYWKHRAFCVWWGVKILYATGRECV